MDLWWSHPAIQKMGWVLVHFVWQGALVAGALAVALALLRAERARLRYALSLAALVVLLALPVATWLVLPGASPAVQLDGAVGTTSAALTASPVGQQLAIAAPSEEPSMPWIETARTALVAGLPWLVIGWLGGVLVLALRFLGGWAYTLRLRRTHTRPVTEAWQCRFDALADRLGVRHAVRLRQSTRIDVPMVIGWARPVVLVPVSVFTGLPPAQVEALIVHELAHIQRHDMLVGRLQAVAETLLFYHPAVWWVSRQVRIEREHCCDDWVVQTGRDRVSYARALTTLAARHGARPTGAAMAATDGTLLTRIRRLVGQTQTTEDDAVYSSVSVGLLAVTVTMLVTVGACASQQGTVESDAAEPPASTVAAAEAPDSMGAAEDAKSMVDTAEAAEWRVRRIRPDSSDRVVTRVFRGTVPDTIDGFSFVVPEVPDSLGRDIRLLLRRHLAGSDTISLPPLPDGPRMFYLDSLRAVHPPFPPGHPLMGALRDTLDHGAFRVRIDSLRTMLQSRLQWGPDSLEQTQLDSLRHEMHRKMRDYRDEVRILRRELHERLRAEQPDRLREQAEALRRQAEELEQQARALEQHETPPGAKPDREGNG